MRKKQCPRNLNIFCPSFFGKPDLGLRLLKITFLKVARHLSKKSCGWYWLINSLSCLRSLHFGWFICYTLTPRQFHSFRLRKSNPSWVLIPHFLLIDPTFAAWDVGDVFSRGLPVLETNFWMTRLIAGYKHSHLFLQGISVYFSFDVPKPTNQFSLSMLTNPFESQLMRIISSTFSSLNLSSTGLMASANLAAVRWPRWHQLGKTKQHGFPLPTCIDGVWWDITEQIVGDLDILNEKDLGFRWGMMGWNHHNGHHWMVLYPICGIGIWSASGPRTFWSSLRCHQT